MLKGAEGMQRSGRWLVLGIFLLAFLLAGLAVFLVWHNLRNPVVRHKIEAIYNQRTHLATDRTSSSLQDTVR